MPDFVSVPKDVLVKVLYDLDVSDLLSFERTCKHARDTVLTRILWLNKMDSLDQTCAPDLPPNVDINSLTAHKLRRIVTTALRTHSSVTSLRSAVAEYVSTKTIIPSLPAGFPSEQAYLFRDVKLAPGGRYLFVLFASEVHNQLAILDLANDNQCVWSNEPRGLDGGFGTIVGYDFEALEDNSVNLALVIRFNTQNGEGNGVVNIAKVLRLVPGGPGGKMQDQDVIEFGLQHQTSQASCVIKGNFAVFAVASSKIITIVDLQERQTGLFDCSSVRDGPRNLQIWKKCLLYLDKENDEKTRICALDLSQAMTIGSQSPETVKIEDLDVSIYRPTFARDSWDNKINDMRYSFFERRKCSNSGIVVVSMIGITGKIEPELVAVRATFDQNKPKDKKWTKLDHSGETKSSGSRGFPTFAIRLGSKMTCSGRLLVSIQKAGRVGYALASINKYGKLVYAELSQNVYYHVANLPGGINTEYMSNVLSDFMDPYSGALILLRDRKTGHDAIELFYPK